MTDVGKLGRLSLGFQDWFRAWRRSFASERTPPVAAKADLLFLRAYALARSGDRAMALSLYKSAVEVAPQFADAIEAQGGLLDQDGRLEEAAELYSEARRIRATIRQGMPDRHFAVRQRGRTMGEILAYDSVLRSLRKNALPYMARGNAHLANGSPAKALADYKMALKIKPALVDAVLLQAEALVQLGRYREAVAHFESVLTKAPKNESAFGGRAIARMALGDIDLANADFNSQAGLMNGQDAAQACIALRRADYGEALRLLTIVGRGSQDPYWQLYSMTCAHRLGVSVLAEAPTSKLWPGPLLALYAGTLSSTEVLDLATTSARRGEALYQLGVRARLRDDTAARHYFSEVVQVSDPGMIEFSAARNELARR